MKRSWFRYFDDFLSLFYPRLCLACGKGLPAQEEIICVSCQYHLPKTQFHLEKENPFTDRFWGRVELESGSAMYRFVKGGRIQNLIHKLKYEGKREVGKRLGKMYGLQLKEVAHFQNVDFIVPVPLHPRKLHKRGFNQSDYFAMGLSESMGVPWLASGLKRVAFTGTQTKKSRLERLANVEDAFVVGQPKLLEGKHVLIVDDVLTTGATLEACAIKMLTLPNTKVSLATIAFATA